MKRDTIIAAAGAAVFALSAPSFGVFGLILAVCVIAGLDLLTDK